jgi:hypothetical protein
MHAIGAAAGRPSTLVDASPVPRTSPAPGRFKLDTALQPLPRRDLPVDTTWMSQVHWQQAPSSAYSPFLMRAIFGRGAGARGPGPSAG